MTRTLTKTQKAFLGRFLDISLRDIPKPNSSGLVRKRSFLITRWQSIPAALGTNLEQIMAAIADELPHETPGDLRGAVAPALRDLVETTRTRLNDAIDAAVNAGDPEYSAVRDVAGAIRKDVAADPVLNALQAVPFVAGTPFTDAFTAALDEVEAVLAA